VAAVLLLFFFHPPASGQKTDGGEDNAGPLAGEAPKLESGITALEPGRIRRTDG
jgi:hypothetical protein